MNEVLGGVTSANRQDQPNQVAKDNKGREIAPCGCLKRTLPPPPPNDPPFAITPENVDQVRDYFLDHYASSSFNTCPHQPLSILTMFYILTAVNAIINSLLYIF